MLQDRAASEDNFRRFVERVCKGGVVWGLRSKQGWAFCDSNEYEDTDVLVFWSDQASAQRHAKGEWSAHRPTAIPLDEFIDRWLAGMDQDGTLVGPNWDATLSGLEVEPHEIAEKLSSRERQ